MIPTRVLFPIGLVGFGGYLVVVVGWVAIGGGPCVVGAWTGPIRVGHGFVSWPIVGCAEWIPSWRLGQQIATI